MSATIITFPGVQGNMRPETPIKTQKHDATSRADVSTRPAPEKSRATNVGRRKKDGKSRSVEPNIQEIGGENGRRSYRVQIRKTVAGKSISFTKTFSKLAMARKWTRRKLAEIEIDGVQTVSRSEDTVADAITARLATHKEPGAFGNATTQLAESTRVRKDETAELTLVSMTDPADDMPGEERQPQTVAGYLAILVDTLDWASRRDFTVPIAAVKQAMEHMWEEEILARAEERDRRPTIDELNKLLEAVVQNKRQEIPLAKLIVFAIFSCRRLGEICRLSWADLRVERKKILVRDMKHPRRKKGNDVWCNLTEEALAIILWMPRDGEFTFPVNAKSVGTAWRRYRDRLEIKDLRFHDLRHEGITRLFEMGKPAEACLALLAARRPGFPPDLIVEPAAGDGVFLDRLPEPRFGIDEAPTAPGMETGNFLAWAPGLGLETIAVVGNPPFGHNAAKAEGVDPQLLEARFRTLDFSDVRECVAANSSVSKSDIVALYHAQLDLERLSKAATQEDASVKAQSLCPHLVEPTPAEAGDPVDIILHHRGIEPDQTAPLADVEFR